MQVVRKRELTLLQAQVEARVLEVWPLLTLCCCSWWKDQL